VLDYLLATPQEGVVDVPGIAGSIRHLVVAVEHNKYYRPPSPARESDDEEGEVEEVVEEDAGNADTPEEQQTLDEVQKKNDDELEMCYDDSESKSEPEEDIDAVAFHARLPTLFKKTRNLRSLHYHNCPGLGLARESVELLATCEGLQTFSVDTTIREMAWIGSHAYEDPESWECVFPSPNKVRVLR
jgi:hypothetical protein